LTDSDAIYHRLFSHPLMAEQLVREFAPAVTAAGADFTRMEKAVAKFHADSGARREGDVIWRLPIAGGQELFLYVLMEFQSRSDWWMAVRAQVYEGLLWQHIIAERGLKSGDRLPPVLMIVLYNGEARWSAPADVAGLSALEADSPLWPWQPQSRYHVLDIGAFDPDDLARRDSPVALLFRLEQGGEPEDLAESIGALIAWFRRHPGYDELKRLFGELARQAIKGAGLTAPVPDDMTEMKAMLATQGEAWKRRWTAEGVALGKAEGVAEGKAEMLLRQLRRRFGPLAPEVSARVAAADADQLDLWADRLMDGGDLNDVFGEVPAP
jgi:hypothetical protein